MIFNPLSFRRSQPGRRGFTLIELLTVVAVIGILAGILIPVVGGARTTANRAKSKSQFQGWGQGLLQYQTEYGYFPDIGSMASTGNSSETTLNSGTNSRDFILALSARNPSTGNRDLTKNPRGKAFYSFAESEFKLEDNGDVSRTQLADAFNNTNIKILVDSDRSGQLTLPEGAKKGNNNSTTLRSKVAIWTLKEAGVAGSEDVFSWN